MSEELLQDNILINIIYQFFAIITKKLYRKTNLVFLRRNLPI